MSKTITIEIPAPPEGWVYEKRPPSKGEVAYYWDGYRWVLLGKDHSHFLQGKTIAACAYRVRDEYAERYEALKLPDGFCWSNSSDFPCWSNDPHLANDKDVSARRIVNGKAIKP